MAALLLHADYAERWATSFQDPASGWMYAIVDLHDRLLFYLILVLCTVAWFLTSALLLNPVRGLPYRKESHGDLLELGWTLAPALILWAVGLPSLRLLYLMDEVVDPELTVKAIGHQWYWSYEYTDGGADLRFDSFLVDDASLTPGDHRMLEVDAPLVLPVNASLRLLVTAADVIHSFAVPSLGIKLDAIPGRLNGVGLVITRPGTFYGQCSELCGFLHGMMPIAIRAVSLPAYLHHLDTLVTPRPPAGRCASSRQTPPPSSWGSSSSSPSPSSSSPSSPAAAAPPRRSSPATSAASSRWGMLGCGSTWSTTSSASYSSSSTWRSSSSFPTPSPPPPWGAPSPSGGPSSSSSSSPSVSCTSGPVVR